MRTIAGYTGVPEAEVRGTQLRIIATSILGVPTDLTNVVRSVSVSDSCLRTASSATVELSRDAAAVWEDPIGGVDSPLTPGSHLSIEMGERDGTLVRIFDGTITEGDLGSDFPAARDSITAIGGKPEWWTTQLTTAIYTAGNVSDLVEAIFVAHGGLIAPGDFDLPAATRVITKIQGINVPIMNLAADLYEPLEYCPWWDPTQQKLSTLDCAIAPLSATPVIPSLLLADAQRGQLRLQWREPEATRVLVRGGSRGIQRRLEVAEWEMPGPLTDSGDSGVDWASGSKNDKYDDVWWADITGLPKNHGARAAGEYLWVQLHSEWGEDGWGYRGPGGVDFLVGGSHIEIDPSSTLGFLGGVCLAALVVGDHIGATEDRIIADALFAFNVTVLVPPPPTSSPDLAWASIVGGADTLAFDFRGAQIDDDALEQLTAQAWDSALISQFGERRQEYTNAALYVTGDVIGAVEAEAVRRLAKIVFEQHQASLSLIGQDLRILPGDTIQVAHPRQDVNVIIQASTVTQTWNEGKGSTNVEGFVVSAAEP